jgi:hypothetical protein
MMPEICHCLLTLLTGVFSWHLQHTHILGNCISILYWAFPSQTRNAFKRPLPPVYLPFENYQKLLVIEKVPIVGSIIN